MMWQDIIVNRILTKVELTNALCSIFQIDNSKLIITPTLEDTIVADDAEVICETSECKAEYPLILSIYLKKENPKDSLALIGTFCEMLNCEAIISDDSPNPFTMLHVLGKGRWEQISIDLSTFDDNEGIEIP
ncbi:hypothetical protein ACFQZT_12755 [Paenibacillus sp. GCM10027628]|uniref:hypothetical protein n=1 Tax=Paenibacillus sp. GCM10027628 TaxID=3273413 RepID=UPI0036416738